MALTAKWCKNVFNFDYTGGEQTFNTSDSCGAGYYKLEVWGAQGAYHNIAYRGGYGGYSVGLYKADASQTLYVYVGGKGETKQGYNQSVRGGWNGGGGGASDSSGGLTTYFINGGGGGTDVATVRSDVTYTNYRYVRSTASYNSRIIVAGGGSGGEEPYNLDVASAIGGNGGGYIGESGHTSFTASSNERIAPTGGTQTSGGQGGGVTANGIGQFGYGGNDGTASSHKCVFGGGGGGWYGGAGANGCNYDVSGSGGSGYIGSANLISGFGVTKHMACNSCPPSPSSSVTTYTISNTITPTTTPTADVARIGNGYARITWMGDKL